MLTCERFRWVVCQFDSLRHCLNLPALRKTLRSLPKDLDDTYDRMLANVSEDYTGAALKILQWLVYALRPLSITEAAELIAVDVKDNPRVAVENRLADPRDVLLICSSLTTTFTLAKDYAKK